MNTFIANYKDGHQERITGCLVMDHGAQLCQLADADWEQIESVDWWMHDFEIQAGAEGFFLIEASNVVNRQCAIGYYTERPDGEYQLANPYMPLYGLKYGDLCRTVIVTGMRYDMVQRIEIQNNTYILSLRFLIDGSAPYEPIAIRVEDAIRPDATYCDMARVYRNYQLAHGFVRLRDRLNPTLAYSVEAPNVRIRMGWKPVPTPVPEQTPENEPPMHVACTFDDVIALIDEYRAAGIEKAELCLVGWNSKGHDGRWPQILPIDEEFGGEEGLRRLIAYAKENGYTMNCHTSFADAYSIANTFNKDDMIVKKNGEISTEGPRWAGGRTYHRCSATALAQTDDMSGVAQDLGFFGTHYIDVLSAVPPRTCIHPDHPTTRTECAENWTAILGDARRRFGAVCSEGPFDHSLVSCDGVLYTSFHDYKITDKGMFPVADEMIPLWQLVYHGIVLSTPFSRTLNSILSPDPDDTLKVIEYGGRPQLYYYARFVTDGSDWIGQTDFACHTDEDRKRCAEKLRETMDIFEPLTYLQYEFMEKHEKVADGVYAITYSDGSVVKVDYNTKTYTLKKGNEA